MLLIKSQNLAEPLDLDELMRYSLTPVPHSLGTPDGFSITSNAKCFSTYIKSRPNILALCFFFFLMKIDLTQLFSETKCRTQKRAQDNKSDFKFYFIDEAFHHDDIGTFQLTMIKRKEADNCYLCQVYGLSYVSVYGLTDQLQRQTYFLFTIQVSDLLKTLK